jgi:BatD DUF11 like domain
VIRWMRACWVLVAIVACSWCAAVNAAEVRAWLDRGSMQLGETVTLNIEVSGDTHVAQPDFNALRQDFELLGTQSSSSVNIVNGQASSKLLWAVGLQPKRAGALAIPPLDVAGQHTQALTLNVQPASASASGKAGDDVYIEIVAEPRSPYVQQQVQFKVKLYFALNFSDGGLDDPQADGLVVHKLGQDAYYAAEVGGRRYRVWEKRYAMVAEKSGKLALPPINFRGHAIDPADVNSFFNRGRAVSARSEAIEFDVRPRPAAAGTEAWLPAHAVTLTADGIDAHNSGRVGEPLTLTLHLKAQGMGFEQLPDLKLPPIDGADVYPDKTTTQNHDDGEWLYGERERKFALVPNRPGSLVLPAISLQWWDTANDRAESADLPSMTINIEPAAGATIAPDSAKRPTNATAKNEENVPALGSVVSNASAEAEALMWRRWAFTALTLWTLTLLAIVIWLMTQRRRRISTVPLSGQPAGHLKSAFRDAAKRGDWVNSARALLAWAQGSGAGARNLGELGRRVHDKAQAEAISDLDRACYGSGATDGLQDRLAEAFARGLALAKPGAGASPEDVLPQLYPNT